MRSRSARTDAGLTSMQIVFIAVGVLLAALIVYVIVLLTSGGSEEPSGTPTPSASVTPIPSPTSTMTTSTGWADVSPDDRPPFLAGRSGEPEAREWADWVIDLVDDTWNAETWCDRNPDWEGFEDEDACLYQALYLVAPDGERLRRYELRADVLLRIEATAMEEQIVWISRLYYESLQTVEFDLATGTVDEDWARDGFTNVSASSNQEGWFVFHSGTLADGRMVWEGSGFGSPLVGVFFRDPGGAITPSNLSPHFFGSFGAPYCLGVDPDAGIAIYEDHGYAEGEPVANWPATLVKHDLVADTWITLSRLGPYGSPCIEEFEVTATYYIGYANRVDQQGLHRYYFDGSPDQPVP